MENMLSISKMFNNLYKTENGISMKEMRMRKMMYLSQRESLMYNKAPLFDDQFEGRMYGPVLIDVKMNRTLEICSELHPIPYQMRCRS